MQVIASGKTIAPKMVLRQLNCFTGINPNALRIVKLTTIILLASCLQLSARGIGQTITLSLKDVPLITVFKEIERQTQYTFFYERERLQNAKNVTVAVSNLTINQVLDVCFKGQPFSYLISGQTITITTRKERIDKDGKASIIVDKPLTDIRGRVVNSNGEPVANATVTVKGTSKATSTDADGNFSLTGMDENAVLVITHVQYEAFTTSLNGNKAVYATLQTKINSLDELQVIAYGNSTRRFNTGNVSTIKASDIASQPVTNPLLALQARVPGLFITQSTGFTGGGATALIQGQNSLRKGNDPFIVIDGVPYTSQLLPNLGSVVGYSGVNITNAGNPLNYINPSDIESITVLKDADATAIYGSRAANGAILITTKKGKAGETRFDFDVQNGWGQVSRKIDLMNTPQYLEMRKEALKNDGVAPGTNDYDLTLWDTTKYTDWQKVLIGGTANYLNVSGSASGGNTTTQFEIGATYHRETTVFPGNFADQRGSVHFSINSISRNQKIKIQLTGNYMVDNNKLPNNDLTSNSITLAPDAPSIYNPDGTFNWAPTATGVSSWNNPVAQLLNRYNNKTNNLVTNLQISYEALPGLTLNGNVGYTNLQSNEVIAVPLLSTKPENRANASRSASYGNNNINSWIVEPNVTYKKSISKGKLETLVGATIQQQRSNGQLVGGSGFNSDEVLENMGAAATLTPFSSTISTYKYNAVFARINYNWKDRYIINLSGRRDGSSRFGSENMFHNFGAVGVSWIYSEEQLFKNNLNFLSFGKLRASYGTTGNDQILDYQFLSLYSPVFVGPYQNTTGLAPNGLTNPYLQWEETKKLNLGMDLGFLANRILLSANYYRNRSSNQLLQYNLPSLSGFSFITENFPAIVENFGWEFSLGTVNLKAKNFEWRSNLNLTIPRNKLVRYDSLSTSSDANNLVVGQPITMIKVYHYLGVDPTSGLYSFADSKGNRVNRPSFPTDLTVNINTSPVFYGGFENSFSYKSFEINVLFQYVKRKGINYVFGANRPGARYFNQPAWVVDRWQKTGDEALYQRYSAASTASAPFSAAATRSDAAYIDASFARLKNVQISWQLPRALYRKYANTIRVFALGQNLATITNYKGLDPETLSTTALPPLRVFTFGVHLGF